jgi:hypothetical protein
MKILILFSGRMVKWILLNENNVLQTSVCLMMIRSVTHSKDRPNHRCTKNQKFDEDRKSSATNISDFITLRIDFGGSLALFILNNIDD